LPFSGRVHSYPQFIVRKVPKGVEQLVLCFTGGIEFPILSYPPPLLGGLSFLSSQKAGSEAEQAGAAIGATLGLGMIFGLWFIVLVGALVLGLFLKKSGIVEKGPTGPLAKSQ